ncbi:MAG: hypothetical protein ABEJ96_11765, partial [Thiohalorhabdaceae bacterium]
MSFNLTDIVPFGRSYAEYRAMFALDEADLAGRILDCGGGPAAFNAELTRNGGTAVAVDPIYAFDAAAIRARIDEVVPDMVAKLAANRDKFRWDRSGSPAQLVALRQAAMDTFLADYPSGCREGRYVAGALAVGYFLVLGYFGGVFGLAAPGPTTHSPSRFWSTTS